MVSGILRFEWRYQTRRLGFVAAAAVFACCGFALAATAFGPGDIHLNSPYSIAESVGLSSLVAVLAATFFAAQAALRDTEHRMAEIVYSTAITRPQYVLTRFAGLAAATCAAFVWVFPGLSAGTFAVAHDPGRVAPWGALPYLWAGAVLALPNLLLVSAVLFALALTTRSTLATYVGGVVLYLLYWALALFSGSPLMAGTSPPSTRGMAIAALLDPFGLSAFFEQTRYWTAAERDVRLLDLGGHLLWNRLLWLGVTVLLVSLVLRGFAFRLPTRAGRARRVAADESLPAARVPPALRRVTPSAGASAALRTCLSVARREMGHALRSWPLVALLVAWAAMNAIELSQTLRHAEFGTALLPATSLILDELGQPLSLFGLLVLLYFAAELVWRERAAGMNEIVDATPVPNGALFAGKLAALVALIVLLAAVGAATGMAIQLASGWTRLEPALYGSLLAFVGVPLALVAVLAVLLQALVPNRYLGILVSAAVVVWWHLGALGGPDHPLLRYAAAPEVPYSDLAGFGPEAFSLGWFSVYWGAFAALLAALACALWRRGTDARLSLRLAALRRRWSPGNRGLALVCFAAWIGFGGAVFVQTNRWNAYRTERQVERWSADYERRYRWLETVPQPTPVDVRVDVDLRPEERRYSASGAYLLGNRSGAAIDTLWVMTRRDLSRVELRLRGRGPAESDAEFGAHRFALSPPLAPGESVELDFDLAVVRRGAVAGGADRGIASNGTFLLSYSLLPSIGYRRGYELTDPGARMRQGLAERARPATLEEADLADLGSGAPSPFAFEATVATAPDQIALAPGTLLASGERDGRRFFQYRAEGAVTPLLAFVSARYAVERREHAGVAIEVYHHPEHRENVAAMLDAAAASLDYCIAQFGPYPHRELRIVEVPSSSPMAQRGTGLAAPGTIYLLENRSFLTDRRDPGRIDVVAKRVAHEVAHQWWGHQVAPAPLPGASTLVETLARYTEMRVLAGLHGESAVPPILAYELDRYLAGRTGGDEAPLAEVEDQSYVYYSKGGLVMAAVRDLIGESAVNAALRRLVDQARGGRQPDARDLLAELEREAPPAQRELLARWWRGIVLYDLRLAAARATPQPDGRMRLALRIEASKSDGAGGREQALPMDEELEVALYAEDPGVDGSGAPLATGRYRVSGATEVVLDADARARFVVVDPNLLRIDRNRADNLRAIELGGP